MIKLFPLQFSNSALRQFAVKDFPLPDDKYTMKSHKNKYKNWISMREKPEWFRDQE